MKKRLLPAVTLTLALLLPQPALAWNATGHKLVARIAWENMSLTARQRAIEILQKAPEDACLLDLFPNNTRPLEERQRQFFMLASTWSDIVRPQGDNDPRACTRFHRTPWHFINFFWEGISGATGDDRPRVRTDIPTPTVNAVERLNFLRPTVPGGAPPDEQATNLAWILHLVGDLHQPLHTCARVTTAPGEERGDQGGNLFKLGTGNRPPSLHGFWDGIVDESVPKRRRESDNAYLERVARTIMRENPRARVLGRLRPIDFMAWSREGFTTTMRAAYPATLERNVTPQASYKTIAFTASKPAIALGGYRLAELLNQMLGS